MTSTALELVLRPWENSVILEVLANHIRIMITPKITYYSRVRVKNTNKTKLKTEKKNKTKKNRNIRSEECNSISWVAKVEMIRIF